MRRFLVMSIIYTDLSLADEFGNLHVNLVSVVVITEMSL